MQDLLGIDDFLHQRLEFRRIGVFVPHRLLCIDKALVIDFGGRDDLGTALDHGFLGSIFLGTPELVIDSNRFLGGLADAIDLDNVCLPKEFFEVLVECNYC